MSQNTRESLSAMMDGESDELELRRVLKALPNNADAADTWRRYHLARSLMQREQGVDVSIDLSAGVMARLQEEPVPLADTPLEAKAESVAKAEKVPTISFARGAGVAAAVSLMVVTGVQYFNSGLGDGNDGPSVDRSASVANAPSTSASATQQVQPVSLATSELSRVGSANSDIPMFEPTPFRLNGQSANSGFMNVSEGGFSAAQLPSNTTTNNVQNAGLDLEQTRLLRSYLEQHAHGAAYGNSDSWLPLMRSAMSTESLGQ
ncbi:sigma-E factor negative regulatory protein [Halomonas llamarensis]|uniref:Sigma-E factor negative regulatory protein n=1 Tax=Halomonas llamarensis TaxID=2945104 RepID=A0ABT0SMV5_9GAMM|nr:sigma-E factor negative regulatory protein [Halomonas llamarensis]MCL7928805.1 sigma-E factor negative regulatory protein [Halomonas llamarensis]